MLRYRKNNCCLEASRSRNGMTYAWVVNAECMIVGYGKSKGHEPNNLREAVLQAVHDAEGAAHPFRGKDWKRLREET